MQIVSLRRLVAAPLTLAVVALSCSESGGDGSACQPGSLRCECSADGTCDNGLSCLSDVCVDAGIGGSESTAGGTNGQPSSGGEVGDAGGDEVSGRGSVEAGGSSDSGGGGETDDAGGESGEPGTGSVGGRGGEVAGAPAGGQLTEGGGAGTTGGVRPVGGSDGLGGEHPSEGGSPGAGGNASGGRGGNAGQSAQAGADSVGGANPAQGGGPTVGGAAGAGGEAPCLAGVTRRCAEGGLYGACAGGVQTCLADHTWTPCPIAPAASDTCVEGNDDNCDGVRNGRCECIVGSVRPCSQSGDLGNCADGQETCSDDGTWGPCSIQPAETDACTPGDDADCDGAPNEGCSCVEGDEQVCGESVDLGICQRGISRCVDGAWTICEGVVFPETRSCMSSDDNNCDGVPDNTLDAQCQCAPGETRGCGFHDEDGTGTCKTGVETCAAWGDGSRSSWPGTCVGSVGPQFDICDGKLDEDCDGIMDTDCPCPGTGGPNMARMPDNYCIDRTEVTRSHYAAWLAGNPSISEQGAGCEGNTSFLPNVECMASDAVCATDCDEHPQVCVDWCDASAYCQAVGKRLCGAIPESGQYGACRNDQWCNACSSGGEFSYAFGEDGEATWCNWVYSWGNPEDATTVPVGSLPRCHSPAYNYGGVHDLAGNVSEWLDECSSQSNQCTIAGDSFNSENRMCSQSGLLDKTGSDPAVGFRCCAP